MKPPLRDQLPAAVRRALAKLGADLAIARRKRRLRAAEVAAAAGIAPATLRRLERGDPAVAFGAVAMVLHALGEPDRISDLLDVSRDDAGLLLDLARLPQRVRSRRAPTPV